jgi:hypothetical protein
MSIEIYYLKKTKQNKKQSKNIRISLVKFNNLKKKLLHFCKNYISKCWHRLKTPIESGSGTSTWKSL